MDSFQDLEKVLDLFLLILKHLRLGIGLSLLCFLPFLQFLLLLLSLSSSKQYIFHIKDGKRLVDLKLFQQVVEQCQQV